MRTALAISFLAVGVLVFACSSDDSSSTCTCKVTSEGETKEMTCGQQACVAGSSFTCSEGSSAPGGNACSTSSSSSSSTTSSSGSASSSSSSSSTTSSTGGTAGKACDDLALYCASKCKAPPTVNKACTDTVDAANGSKCVAWQATNGSLCKAK